MSLLLDKYLFYRPTGRLLADWATHGLDLSLGTVTDGLRHLVPLFEPVYEVRCVGARCSRCGTPTRPVGWCSPSSRGRSGIGGICGSSTPPRWWSSCWRGRSHDVPEEHFGPVEGRGILVVDRYKAYQAIDKVKSGLIVLAFCWAHVRRDFLGVARSWPDQEGWAWDWVSQIGTLYHLNDERLKVREDAAAFAAADGALRAAVTSFGERGQAELREGAIHPARRKVLESLGDHWTGLTVFVEHPEVPMDNKTAEARNVAPWWVGRTTMAADRCGAANWR